MNDSRTLESLRVMLVAVAERRDLSVCHTVHVLRIHPIDGVQQKVVELVQS
jgi:hypothetical protein